jgi:putative tricarboxylic transport membrane protein
MGRRGCLAALIVLLAGACTQPGSLDDLRVMVPNAPGGGYDTTARVVAQVLEDEELTGHVEVFNLEGGSGVVGLARTAHEQGNPDLMMMMGLGVVDALFATDSAVDLDQVTPVARLISEPEIVVVPSGSRFHTLDQLMQAWVEHPTRLRVGGGSSAGGPDHLAAHLLADAVGIEPRRVRYAQYDGGGPLLAAMFSGRVDFAVSGIGEYVDHIANGEVQVLAVTSREHIGGFDAPTLRELGVPLEFTNWRGLVAPPGLSAADESSLIDLVTRMHDTQGWRDAERRYGWGDDLLTGEEFGTFLRRESQRVADVLRDLGFTDHRTPSGP